MTLVQEGPVILIGYEYRLRIAAEVAAFPMDARFMGQMRASGAATEVLATGSSDAGMLVRIDDMTLDIVIPPIVTATLAPGSVVLDLVRIDLDPDRHLGVLFEIPVVLPVTRGL